MPRDIDSQLSRWAAPLGAVWGFAEATVFFLVPDVLLSLVACRVLRPALRGTLAALLGALLGGALMYAVGQHAPGPARSLLVRIPAISPALVASVESQVAATGLRAVLLGPLLGTPYKIYAVEWGARHGTLVGFLAISIPARYARFLLSVLIAHAVAHVLKLRSTQQARTAIAIWALFWLCFYSVYFLRFGW